MKTGQAGITLIKQFEGCRLTAYKCPAGVWTIGYGHTAGVKAGQTITQAQAENFLRADLEKYEKKVDKYSRYSWNQNEFDALVSFAYNIGSIDQLTQHGVREKGDIPKYIMRYNRAGGKVLEGLTKRREAEKALFLMPCARTGAVKQKETSVVEYSLKADGEKSVSKNFKVKEFKCKDGSDRILVDVDFVKDKLQAIRDHFGAAVTVNSAYRTESYNRKVGGASKSYHMTGQAFDIAVKRGTPLEVARYAQELGVKGIIQYNNFVHVDSRSTKYWARNNNGKVTVKSSF